MTPEERKVFENIRSPHLKYWIPVVWFSNLASKARQEGRIQDSIDLQNILNVTHEIKEALCVLCQNMNHCSGKLFHSSQRSWSFSQVPGS